MVHEGLGWDRKDLGPYWLKGMVKGWTMTQGTKDGPGWYKGWSRKYQNGPEKDHG